MLDSKPHLIVVAGPNGSGKTSITEPLLRHTGMDGGEYVNPDQIARDVFGDWNAPGTILITAKKRTEIRNRCLADRVYLDDNSVDDIPSRLVRRLTDERPVKSYGMLNEWAADIVLNRPGIFGDSKS